MEKLKTCTGCGSVYELSFTRTLMRDKDLINCEVCGELLYQWSEAKIWEAKLNKKMQTICDPLGIGGIKRDA